MQLKYISWIPAFVIMIIIFLFSSKPANESRDTSITIAEQILSIYEDITNQPIHTEVKQLEEINHFIRKGAHFTEYALLAIAVAFHFYVCKKRGLSLIFITILIAAFYAATDEFHQLFVEGRGGQVTDVILDTTGAIAGTLLFAFGVSFGKGDHRNKG